MLKTIFLLVVAVVFSLTTIVLANTDKEFFKISVSHDSLTQHARNQVECLADNIFFEAAYEPLEGQVAVAIVTFNRVNSTEFAGDICGVVKEKTRVTRIGNQRVVCQFSWYCQQREKDASYNKEKYLTSAQKIVYDRIYNLAFYLYVNSDKIQDNTGGALFYHADYVSPNWRNLNRTVKIGRHIFYKPDTPGDRNNGKYDAEIKPRTEGRFSVAFLLPSDGRH